MKKRTSGQVAAALIAVLSTLAFAAIAPSAGAISYCGIPVNPLSACSQTTGSVLLAYNEARYNGAGSINVCQKVMQGATQVDRLCARDKIWTFGALPYGSYVGYVGNDSAWVHTIDGRYEVCCGLAAARRTAAIERERDPAAATPTVAKADFAVFRVGTSAPAATVTHPDDQVSLTATEDELCLESTQLRGGSCQPYAKAVAGQLLAAAICSPRLPRDRVAVYGAAPDGVTLVRAIAADGSTIAETPVTRNTFTLSLAKSDASITDHFESIDEDGTSSLGTVLPSDLGC